MELPREHTLTHPHYGSLPAEKLGIGYARHWLMKLADALQAKHVFMLDDSVRSWKGVTLAEDPHSMYGKTAGKLAQMTNLPLAEVLAHFAESKFLTEELPKF